jgi:transcriptional regulator with XRE-family HTH domain
MHLFWGTCYSMPALLERHTRLEASALKQTLSRGLNIQLKRRGTSRAALARELGTSRSAVERVLDKNNTSITLHTLVRAANVLGYRLELRMEPRIDKIEEVKAPVRLKPLMKKLGEALDRLPDR